MGVHVRGWRFVTQMLEKEERERKRQEKLRLKEEEKLKEEIDLYKRGLDARQVATHGSYRPVVLSPVRSVNTAVYSGARRPRACKPRVTGRCKFALSFNGSAHILLTERPRIVAI